MASMKKIAVQVGLVAMLALLGAATAQAYDFPLANKPYHCRWERTTSSGQLIKGVSLVTFTNVSYPSSFTQKGTLFTVYADAGTLTKNYEVQLHVAFGGLTYYQPNAINPELQCKLLTSSGANTVEWDCTGLASFHNGVRQWCYQP
jgi:hypothetical protein